MKKPLKWPLNFDNKGIAEQRVPQGSDILCIQVVRNQICLYTLSDLTKEASQVIKLKLLMTGEDTEDTLLNHWTYLTTIQLSSGMIVGHVFRSNTD